MDSHRLLVGGFVAFIKEKSNKDGVVGNYWRIGPVTMDLCKQNSLRDAVRVPRVCVGIYLFKSKTDAQNNQPTIHEEFYTLKGDDIVFDEPVSVSNPVEYAYALVKEKIAFFNDVEDDI